MRKNKIDIIFFNRERAHKKLLLKILERLMKKKILKEEAVISLVIVDSRAIKEINKCFRGKNIATSVLSFPLKEKEPFVTPGNNLYLGDIILNIEKIKRENRDFKKALKENLVHAFLHLMSYGHDNAKDERVMEQEEERLLGAINDI